MFFIAFSTGSYNWKSLCWTCANGKDVALPFWGIFAELNNCICNEWTATATRACDQKKLKTSVARLCCHNRRLSFFFCSNFPNLQRFQPLLQIDFFAETPTSPFFCKFVEPTFRHLKTFLVHELYQAVKLSTKVDNFTACLWSIGCFFQIPLCAGHCTWSWATNPLPLK